MTNPEKPGYVPVITDRLEYTRELMPELTRLLAKSNIGDQLGMTNSLAAYFLLQNLYAFHKLHIRASDNRQDGISRLTAKYGTDAVLPGHQGFGMGVRRNRGFETGEAELPQSSSGTDQT